MIKQKKLECAYVAQELKVTADKVYEQLYGGWKKELIAQKNIKPPTKDEFDRAVQALLPQKYMNGVHGYHPNKFFKLVLNDELDTIENIIEMTQYISIQEFSEKYRITVRTVEKEWDSLWTIVAGYVPISDIPIAVADDFYGWITKEFTSNNRYENHHVVKHGGKNIDAIYEIVDAYHVVQKCLLVTACHKREWETACHDLFDNGNARMIRDLIAIWY